MSSLRTGLAAGTFAFTLWGIFPLYWRLLHWVPSGQIIYFRVLFCIPVLLLLVAWKKQGATLWAKLREPSILRWHFITTTLLGLNWYVFIWATQHQRIVEASLGYFLTPLANVAMGAVLLKEKLAKAQWIAVALASSGVLVLVMLTGSLPWIALALCVTFSLYGLLRKRSPLDSLLGLTLESILALPFVIVFLLATPLPTAPQPLDWLTLALSGIITTLPLLAFSTAARSLPLSTLGQLQFIAPTLQFIVGIACGEPILREKLIGFSLIWLAVLLYLKSVTTPAKAATQER